MNAAIVFPGQGTQEPGMGAAWVDHDSWRIVDDVEAALGEKLGWLLTEATADDLSRTREAQLAVLLTSLVAWDALAPTLHGTPVAFGGHSLGQVTALIAAGVLSLDDGVRFAARRAELTQAAADAHPGRMAALLGASPEQAEGACEAAADACWVANDNAPGQIVIAGTPDGVQAGSARAKELGVKRATPLKVGGAFHTPLMQDAADTLTGEVASLTLAGPSAPIVSNEDAAAATDADGWRERLPRHVTVPVRWRTTMTTLTDLGATSFLEVGHGSMLAALAKRGVPDVTVRNVASPADVVPTMEVV